MVNKTTWADVTPGAMVELKGRDWEVVKAKRKGKVVKVTVKGSAGEFASEKLAKERVTIVEPGWADKAGAAKADRQRTSVEKLHAAPKLAPGRLRAAVEELGAEEGKAERTVRKFLDAKLLAVETDGVYVMPHVSPDTIAAHLMAFHGITAEGVTLTEAKTMARTHSPDAAVKLLSWEKLKAVHDDDHAKIEAGTKAALVPHLHTKERES